VLPKNTGTGESFSAGDRIYYDATAKKITATASGNTLCGRALEAAGTADTEVLADLMVLA